MIFRFPLLAAAALAGALSASAQWAEVLTTSPDRTSSLSRETLSPVAGADAQDAIVLTDVTEQEIDGFGYAITYSSAYNLLRMAPADRAELLRRTFSPTEGYGVSYVRMSLGTCDFSSDDYSLCDVQGPDSDPLKNFALHSDELNYVIPILKEILAINPSLKVIATPWTPPRWMKYHEENGEGHELENQQWTGGRLRPEMREVYGEYFVRFIREMGKHGVRIHAVSPQNEPLHWGNSASLYMPWQDEALFVKEGLAPALKKAGLDTKIYIYDHNYNYDGNKLDNGNYPIKVYDRMGTGFEGEELVAGSCWHNYGGSLEDIKVPVIQARPDKELLFTEASIGEWNDGRNLHTRLAYDLNELVIDPVLNRFRGSLVWNFMLDSNKKPYRPKGCSTCYGAVDLQVDSNGNPTGVSENSHYYIMAHASQAALPGSHRAATEGWWTDGLSYAAFINPDGTRGLLLANQNDSKLDVKVSAPTASGNAVYYVEVPAKGVASLRIHPTGTPGNAAVEAVAADRVVADSTDLRYYDLNGRPLAEPLATGITLDSRGTKTLR